MTALLTDNLPLLAGAPNGIKKLRELILELAVRGKLVEQDANDEPASELLKRIAAEKMQLVAEGKIKKQKPLMGIAEEEKPFELPAGWEWCRLQDAFDVRDGTHDSPKYQSSGYPLVTSKNLYTGKLDLTDVKLISEEDHQKISARSKVDRGDVLFAMIGSIGNPAIVDTDVPFSIKNIALLKQYVPGKISSDFLLIYLLVAASDMREKSAGGVQSFVSLGSIRLYPFALPALNEQHRIVAKVDELMALCDRLETQQADAASAHAQLVQALLGSLTQASDAADFAANWQRLAEHFHCLFSTEPSLDALKQTLLQLAVMGKLVPQDPSDEPASKLLQRIQAEKQRLLAEGQSRKQKELLTENIPLPPYGVPNGWAWEILDSILYITGGVTLGRKLAGREMVSKPYLRVANVQRGYLALDVMKEVEVPEDEVSKYFLKEGDLLITEGGDWDKVGRTAVWRNELPECLHQNHVFRARALTDEFESRWAEMYLNSTTARDYFAGSSKQTTNLASINMTQLRACAFPVPPLAEQRRIVAKLDQLMALCNQLKTQLSQARQLNQQLASTLVERALVDGNKVAATAIDQEKARTLLAAEIVQKLHCEKRMGRVKLQKIISLAEHVARLKEIQSDEQRYAAGPHDPALMNQVAQGLRAAQWFEELALEVEAGKKRYEYRPLAQAGAHRPAYEALWSAQQRRQVSALIELMRLWDTPRCERVATLYSAWNDLLIEGREATEAAILHEVLRGWNDSKLKFTEAQWLAELVEMKQHSFLIPTGFGKRTTGGVLSLPGFE
jgi:type I restriction enzyme S subunit